NVGWYLKAVVYKTLASAENNNTIAAFASYSDITPDYEAKMSDFCVEDINGDGVDDVMAVTSNGASGLKVDKMLGKKSNATVYVWTGGEKEYKFSASIAVNGMYRAGVVALDINKDGQNEIAVCGIKDVKYDSSATVTDTVTLLSFKNNALKNIGSAEFDSTISADLVDELNTTLTVNAVCFATTQQYAVNANSITNTNADCPTMICYDGMLLKYSYADKKVSLAVSGRQSYIKSDSVLYEGYSGMVYANAEGDDQEEVFLLYYKGNDRILSMHPDITSQKRAYGGNAVADTPITCFTLGNTDYDSGRLRYDDWAFTYTEPTALAIIAAPPVFGDFLHIEENYIVMGSTTYEISTTTGSSSSIEHAIGAIAHGSFVVAQVDLKTQYTNNYTESTTTTKSTPFSATKETLVVTCVVPVECYYYTILVATPEGVVERPYVIPKEYDAVLTAITIDEYDKLAKKYDKDILKDNVVVHTDGDPASYNYPEYTDLQGENAIRTSYNKSLSGSKIAITTEEEQQHGVSVSLSVMFGAELLGLGGYGGVAFDANATWGQISGSGTEYSANVRNIPEEGVDDGYGFTWRLKVYKKTVDGKEIPFITYHVTNCSTNPKMPENVTAYGVAEYDANGNLIPANKIYWQEYESNKDLDVHYEILRSRDGFEGAFETVGMAPYGTNYFIDKDGLEFGKDYEYKVITVKNDPTAANAKSIESPVAKAKTLNKNGGLTVTVESPVLTVEASKLATVKVNVAGVQEGDKVTYQWERRLFSKGWTTLTNANQAEYKIGAASPLWDKALYRCVVRKEITLADGSTDWIYGYSDPIVLIVE
ncbi:MAG: VCBS repeat-containing protein, partial [Clostridia bacterium]|nr:VCBS repeat-containing protein [Clostridia bacterium]